MNNNVNLMEIFYLADEFCKDFNKSMEGYRIDVKSDKKRRNKPSRLSDSEVITILIAFHLGGYRNLKHFYINYVQKHLVREFPKTVSYNRFTELQKKALLPMIAFLKIIRPGNNTGIAFVDSTPIRVCKNNRIYNHKVFSGLAKRGKSTVGYFFGFKLHIIINDMGEIIDFVITPGNVDDREPLKNGNFLKRVSSKLFADRVYFAETF